MFEELNEDFDQSDEEILVISDSDSDDFVDDNTSM